MPLHPLDTATTVHAHVEGVVCLFQCDLQLPSESARLDKSQTESACQFLIIFNCEMKTFDNTRVSGVPQKITPPSKALSKAGLPPPLQSLQTVSPLCTSAKCPPKAPMDIDGLTTLASWSREYKLQCLPSLKLT